MHELGITRNIVSICSEQAQGRRVTRVRVEIGELAGIMPEAIQFCFGVCREGTLLADARLEVVSVAGRGLCEICGNEWPMPEVFSRCGCGRQGELHCLVGKDMKITEMEVQ
ncbi:hydrogenase maturation nickel metallochaperone HypA [Acidithiobacillus ferrooxidans]|uniref:hydrogenase maturation nickel metallochaperone HypA/HybF n=1 Tax=Acidithiobacillus ferrooxidans TaxID=920 RepID=UPI0021477369|nr:hydrogenase maturation nickel metallochaperone HypA [Acidithiobacillus ferrooxidans]MCR1347466.1 hydrogenase maturation nickel metallochaperone HypA [Acidithiobacillus ferrooxidans]MCR1355381.1 hydrogenase maturation nickel metallochaperone HypA [Acidithiobacillus ferrooxidans]